MQFNIKVQNDFKNNIRREWALTNGLGGYAGGSVTGAINRTHQDTSASQRQTKK